MRTLYLYISIILLCSCHHIKPVSNYTDKGLINNTVIPHPVDTTKTIVVYNVVEKDDEKHRISDETWRFLIGQFFTTITTILTIIAVENPTP